MLLAFDDNGPGPVVVLLHGFPLDRTLWSHQSKKVGAIYRVITPDLRGHGSTAAPEGIYTVDAMADDVIETLDALQLTHPITIGGHSMGGYIALSIAERYPERINALILVNSKAAADTSEARQTRSAWATEIEETGSTEAVIARMIPYLFADATRDRHPDLIHRTEARMRKVTPRAIGGTLLGLGSRADRTAILPQIQVPTLIVAGLEDRLIPHDESQAMAEAIPNAWFVTVNNAGHMAPLENPEAVDAAILGFLESLW